MKTSPNTQSGEDELHKLLDTLCSYDQAGGYAPLELDDDSFAKLQAYLSQRENSLLDEVEARLLGRADGKATLLNRLREQQRQTLKAIRKEHNNG